MVLCPRGMEGFLILKLYFGNLVNTVTTLLLVVLLGFIGVSICHRATITGWGRRTLLALVLGLVICCFAAARDGLDKTIQNAIDGSCAPGLFSLISIPTLAGCVGAFLILLAAVATLFTHSQHMREAWFYVLSVGVLLKVVTVEVCRFLV